jgi:hypothetical protein
VHQMGTPAQQVGLGIRLAPRRRPAAGCASSSSSTRTGPYAAGADASGSRCGSRRIARSG